MKNRKLLIGRNDEKNILNQLIKFRNREFRDVARKVLLIKQGYLLRNGLQKDLDSPGFKAVDCKKISDDDKYKVYADKKFIVQISHKTIFRIWAQQFSAFDKELASQNQLDVAQM